MNAKLALEFVNRVIRTLEGDYNPVSFSARDNAVVIELKDDMVTLHVNASSRELDMINMDRLVYTRIREELGRPAEPQPTFSYP